MSNIIAILAILICGIASATVLTISGRFYKNTILKGLSWFCALFIVVGATFAIVTLSHPPKPQAIPSHTDFHGVTPLSPAPTIISVIGSQPATIVGLRGDTGAQSWQYSLDANSTVQSATLHGGTVYSIVNSSTTAFPRFIALRADDGHMLWQLNLTSQKLRLPPLHTNMTISTSGPVFAQNMLYLNIVYNGSNVALCAFHTNNGSLLNCELLNRANLSKPQTTWAENRQMLDTISLPAIPRPVAPPPIYAPVVYGNTVLTEWLYSSPIQLQAFAADTLLPRWSYKLSTGATNINNGPIIGAAEFFYIYDSAKQQVDALRPTDGTIAWTISLPVANQPQTMVDSFLTATHLYEITSPYPGATESLTAFDLHTGQKDWQTVLQIHIAIDSGTQAVETDATLSILSDTNVVVSLDTATGSAKQTISASSLLPLHVQNATCAVTTIANINTLHDVLFLALQYTNASVNARSIFNFNLNADPCSGVTSISALSSRDDFAYWNYIYSDTANQGTPILVQSQLP